MIEVKSSLNGETKVEVREGYMYMIDFSKLQSVNDLILILASMGIVFPYDHPNIEQLGKFLNIDNPIPLPNQQPKAEFIPLSKPLNAGSDDYIASVEDRIFGDK